VTEFRISKDKEELEQWLWWTIDPYNIIKKIIHSQYKVYESENKAFAIYYGLEIIYEPLPF